MAEIKKRLLEKIESREARIAVLGLGYVGLPLLVDFAEEGFPVVGIDTALRAADCAVLVTDHSSFDLKRIRACTRLLVDTRNANTTSAK